MPLAKRRKTLLEPVAPLVCCAQLEVVLLGDRYDDVYDIWEAAAAASPLVHAMVDLRRNDELPGVLIEQFADGRFDVAAADHIALADEQLLRPFRRCDPLSGPLKMIRAAR